VKLVYLVGFIIKKCVTIFSCSLKCDILDTLHYAVLRICIENTFVTSYLKVQ
jgi:hypothetical protein